MVRPDAPAESCPASPWIDEDVRVLDGLLVKNFIALPSRLLNHVHVGGMKQAAASEPGGIDEVGGIDDQRVALPFTGQALPGVAFATSAS